MIGRFFRKPDPFDDLLTDAASGRLDADGLRRLDELAAHDAERQAARDETLALAELLRSQPPVPAPRSFTLAAPPEPRRAPALPRPIQAMTAAAAIALVALIAVDFATAPQGGAPTATLPTTAFESAQNDAPPPEAAGAPDTAPAEAGEAEVAPSAAREAEGADAEASSEYPQAAPDGASAAPERQPAREWRALDWAVAAAGLATAAFALAHLAAAWLARRRL